MSSTDRLFLILGISGAAYTIIGYIIAIPALHYGACLFASVMFAAFIFRGK